MGTSLSRAHAMHLTHLPLGTGLWQVSFLAAPRLPVEAADGPVGGLAPIPGGAPQVRAAAGSPHNDSGSSCHPSLPAGSAGPRPGAGPHAFHAPRCPQGAGLARGHRAPPSRPGPSPEELTHCHGPNCVPPNSVVGVPTPSAIVFGARAFRRPDAVLEVRVLLW